MVAKKRFANRCILFLVIDFPAIPLCKLMVGAVFPALQQVVPTEPGRRPLGTFNTSEGNSFKKAFLPDRGNRVRPGRSPESNIFSTMAGSR
jgi:hypothetical protein